MPHQDSVTIACLSDTHGLHQGVDVPPGDLLIHAGDHTMVGWGRAEVQAYNAWLGSLPHKRKILVPGNHDRWMLDPALRRLITNATILLGKSVEVLQLKIWGSGVTMLADEPFGVGSPEDRTKLYATIPMDTNIIVTHTPAYGVLDSAPGSPHHSGCPELREAIDRIEPQLLVCGHVHGAHGTRSIGGTMFANAALLGPDGGIEGEPIVLRMPYAIAWR